MDFRIDLLCVVFSFNCSFFLHRNFMFDPYAVALLPLRFGIKEIAF